MSMEEYSSADKDIRLDLSIEEKCVKTLDRIFHRDVRGIQGGIYVLCINRCWQADQE